MSFLWCKRSSFGKVFRMDGCGGRLSCAFISAKSVGVAVAAELGLVALLAGNGQLFTATGTAASQYSASVSSFHAAAETMFVSSFAL